ncbi:MAG: Smr/MutS family protein [Polyangiaceae bacterium]|nr:Smr/MutS family protein [Polyangiaceae bacterium]
MKKKRDKKDKDTESHRPKFDGFKPLAESKELQDQFQTKKKEDAKKAEGASKHEGKPAPAHRSKAPVHASTPSSSADDELTFHRMMSGVTPLDREGASRMPVTSEVHAPDPRRAKEAASERMRRETAEALEHLHDLVDDAAKFEITDDGTRVEGRRTDVSPSLLRSLRRGLVPIDAQLDLHGLTAAEARERLADFLREMRTRGERCVLVIHGKGERAPGAGVLRGEMTAWLSQGRARKHVAAFTTAAAADGGEGAIYVALRR